MGGYIEMTLAGEEWVARWGGDRQRWSLPPLPFLPVARLPPPQKRSLSQGTQNSLTQTSGYIVSLCAPFNQVKVTFSPCLSLVAPCEESPGVAPVSPHPADPGFRLLHGFQEKHVPDDLHCEGFALRPLPGSLPWMSLSQET